MLCISDSELPSNLSEFGLGLTDNMNYMMVGAQDQDPWYKETELMGVCWPDAGHRAYLLRELAEIQD